MKRLSAILMAAASLCAAGTAQAGTDGKPEIGHDGKHLAGAFTTTDMDGNVQFFQILEDETMVWSDISGNSGTGKHYRGADGRNCIQPGPGEGPAFCFNESKPSKAGRWVAIRDDTKEGVVVQRLAVTPPKGK